MPVAKNSLIFFGEILDLPALSSNPASSPATRSMTGSVSGSVSGSATRSMTGSVSGSEGAWSGVGDRVWELFVRDEETARMYEEGFLQLSNRIALAIPIAGAINARRPVGLPFRLLLRLVHALAELSTSGIYLSGSVTAGAVWFGRSSLVGPGLLAAQRLHARLAMYPRVIIDPDLLRAIESDSLLRRDEHDVAEETRYIKKLISEDLDGLWFIDYLSAIHNEIGDDQEYSHFLREHKLHLEEVRTRSSSESALALHRLSMYHNRVVLRMASELGPDGEVPDALLVEPDPRFQHRFG